MDAVILAAGRGSRAVDAAPEFMKPLLEVDGEPLVVRAVRQAHTFAHANRVVVVAAPRNAQLISDALDAAQLDALIVIQSRPRGPGHALLWGLSACRDRVNDDLVLVMIATDVSADHDVEAVVEASSTVVGVRLFNRFEAERFTYYDGRGWHEKEPVCDDKIVVPCWVGLFVGSLANMREMLTYELHTRPENLELPIGPYLGDFMHWQRHRLVWVSSRPIKSAEDYREVISDSAR